MQAEAKTIENEPDLDSYYRSIKASYEATVEAENRQSSSYDGSGTSFVFFLFLLFSLIPAIPTVFYFSVRLVSKPLIVHWWGTHVIPIHSFLFLYVTCSLFFALLFGIRLWYSSMQKRKGKIEIKKDELLNDMQMRFALCYSVISDIELYRTNKRSIHLDKARSTWQKFLISLQDLFGYGFEWVDDLPSGLPHPDLIMNSELLGPVQRRRNLRFFPQIHTFISKFSWFELEPKTVSIISAFDGLRSKFNDRIADKKDLFQVSECLLPLSLYLYTQIPDISDTEEEKDSFSAIERAALDDFAGRMSQIAKYKSEPRIAPAIPKAAIKKAQIKDLLLSTVGSPSTFIRFISTWLVIQIFLAIAIPIFLATVKSIRLDSTLIVFLIGSPLAVAAALTAIPTVSQTNSSDERR